MFVDQVGDWALIEEQVHLGKNWDFIFRLATARSANDGFWAIFIAKK